MGENISSLKLFLQWILVSVMCMGGFTSWSQVGPPTGEGFVIVLANSDINTLEDLEDHKICGGPDSFQAFRELTGVQNAIHVAVPFYEGVPAMQLGRCDAVIAYSTDLGRVRQEGSRWNENSNFRVILFP